MKRKHPNVLFVCIGALRSDFALGEYGCEKPFFDFFDREGTAFETMIAATSSSVPSVASIMTGGYPPDHGVRSTRDYDVDGGVTALAEAFDAAGYETSAHVTGPFSADTDLPAGFDTYEYRTREDTVYTDWFDEFRAGVGDAAGPWFEYLHLWEPRAHRDLPPDASDEELRYDASVRGVAEKLARLLGDIDLSETIVAVTGDHGESIDDGTLRHRAVVTGLNRIPLPLTGKHTQHARRDVEERYLRPRGIELEDYYNSLRRASGVEFPNAFHRLGHGYHVYDFLTRVPFALAGPGVPAGRTVSEQVRQVDVFPTLLSAADLDWPAEVSGQDLLDGRIDHRPAYVRSFETGRSPHRCLDGVRYEGWKFVKGRDRGLRQLFDLDSDPAELHNVVDEHPDVAARLERLVDEHVAREREREADDSAGEDENRVTDRREELGYL